MVWRSVVGEDFAVRVVCDIDVADIFTPPVGSDNEDLVTVLVGLNGWVLALSILHVSKKGMRMATHDQVQTSGLLS